MAKYKAYPEYKDSGVEWLGEIPKHWDVCRLKNLATIKNGQDYKSVQVDDGYPVMGSGGQFTFASKYMYDQPSVLLGRKGTIDKPLYINEPFWTVDTMYYTELNEDVDAKFLYYLALTIQFSRYSTNTALPSMTQEHLSNYKFTVPKALSDRNKITVFLDHETAKIDNLIEKQQQLIELLKEKRQAVISHAVTKGLNPDVPIKDSCVAWLGPISQDCIITKLKYLTVLKTEKTVSKNIRYVGMENISSGTGKFLPKDEVSPEGTSVSFECDDVLFGKLRPYLAKSWLATFSGICSSEFLVFQSKKIHAKYLNYYLLTNEFIKQVDSSTYGSKMPRANWDFISQLPVPMWSYEESKAIAVYLDNLTAKLDWLLEKQHQQINLLLERRTALIFAAVTGKIDVRDWVAPNDCEAEVSQEVTA